MSLISRASPAMRSKASSASAGRLLHLSTEACTTSSDLAAGRNPQSQPCTTLYIPLVISYRNYTGAPVMMTSRPVAAAAPRGTPPQPPPRRSRPGPRPAPCPPPRARPPPAHAAAGKVSDWPKRCMHVGLKDACTLAAKGPAMGQRLAHAFLWEYSYKRLKLAQLANFWANLASWRPSHFQQWLNQVRFEALWICELDGTDQRRALVLAVGVRRSHDIV